MWRLAQTILGREASGARSEEEDVCLKDVALK